MGKVMRSIVALLLVLVCANSVAFAAVEDDREFPEPLIGEEVEATDLIERIEITSENCVKLRAYNDTSKVEGVIDLSDMAYVVLDDSHSVIDDNLSYSRATTSVSWSVKANHLKKADTTFPMEAGECVTINCSYTPRWADVDFGLIAPDNRFYYLPGEDGSINRTIRIDERGEYRFGVYNKSSNIVSVSGFIEY